MPLWGAKSLFRKQEVDPKLIIGVCFTCDGARLMYNALGRGSAQEGKVAKLRRSKASWETSRQVKEKRRVGRWGSEERWRDEEVWVKVVWWDVVYGEQDVTYKERRLVRCDVLCGDGEVRCGGLEMCLGGCYAEKWCGDVEILNYVYAGDMWQLQYYPHHFTSTTTATQITSITISSSIQVKSPHNITSKSIISTSYKYRSHCWKILK